MQASKLLCYSSIRPREFAQAWSFLQAGQALPSLAGTLLTGYINGDQGKTVSWGLWAAPASAFVQATFPLLLFIVGLLGVTGGTWCGLWPAVPGRGGAATPSRPAPRPRPTPSEWRRDGRGAAAGRAEALLQRPRPPGYH